MAGLLASLGLTAVGLALMAQTAFAGPPAEFVGTQSWKDPSVAQLDRLQNAKAKIFRIQISWQSVEPNRPTDCNDAGTRCVKHDYRWGRYDRMFERSAREGVRLLPVLLGSPSWASPDGRWVPVYGRSGYKPWKRQAFYDFAKAARKRYGMNGTFWQGKSYGATAVRARYWQVWNEPNLPNYWWNERSGGRMAKEYAQLLKGTAAALKAGDTSALTVTAGLPWSEKASIQPPDFLQKMFSISGTASASNFVAIHPYAQRPDLVIEGVRLARRALNSTSERAPLWLTEFGWATGGPSHPFRVSESTQAQYLRATYSKLLKVRSSYGIKGAMWFNLIDYRPPGKRDAWYYHTGLLRSDRVTPKKSWKALKCVTGSGTCQY